MGRGDKTRAGSAMSSKQIAYAAVYGRKITCKVLASDLDVVGYVVGMDDYHWLVAVTHYEGIGADPSINTVLVPKNGVLVYLSPEPTLDNEPAAVQVAIENVGRGFWAFCERVILGGGSDDHDDDAASSVSVTSPAT